MAVYKLSRLFKDNGAIFQKPQKSVLFNSVQIWLNVTIIYRPFINEIKNCMDVLVLELDGVKHRLFSRIIKFLKTVFVNIIISLHIYFLLFIISYRCFFLFYWASLMS